MKHQIRRYFGDSRRERPRSNYQGKTLAERELDEKCREHISYFDNLTDEEKQNKHSLDTIHGKVCESLDGKGWKAEPIGD